MECGFVYLIQSIRASIALLLREESERAESVVSLVFQLFRGQLREIVDVLEKNSTDVAAHIFKIIEVFRDDIVSHMVSSHVLGGNVKSFRSIRNSTSVLPENTCASFGTDYGINGVFEHINLVSRRQSKSTAASAFTDNDGYNGSCKSHHFENVFGYGFTLTSFLGVSTTERTLCVDKTNNRAVELFSLLHETERFSVSLGLRTTEILFDSFVYVRTLVDSDVSHRNVAEKTYAGYYCGVVSETSVTVKFNAVGENVLDIGSAGRLLPLAALSFS